MPLLQFRGVQAVLAAITIVLKEELNEKECSLLLGDTESLASSASRLGFLTSDLEAEVVAETSVLANLLHTLQVFSEFGVNHV